jgi:hypothetical protein
MNRNNNINIVPKSVVQREIWVKDILNKATKNSATYNYYRQKMDS